MYIHIYLEQKEEKMMENYETEHRERIRKLAPECMVLLKSDATFPLERAGKIALYGNGARRTLKGGRGSADVNVKSYTTVEQGLVNAGFEITTKYWMDAYEEEWKKARPVFRKWLKEKIAAEGMDRLMENLSIVMPEPEYEIPLTGEGDTAVYVLSRLCGEGVDRQDVKGDFRLTDTEIRDILQLETQYRKFLLVLNTGCIVDLSPVADKVSNILLLSQVGMTIGDSLADVILGKAYPSGKLAATWAAADDYCKIGEFGDRDDTRYREGVYVGYRYFDSTGKTPLFPFGFGLGYTAFSIEPGKAKAEGTKVEIPVTVKNTGNFRGKEVIQMYVCVPEGRLDQPYQTLAAFIKTEELAPGEETRLTLSCRMEDLASTDVERRVKCLEKGSYLFRIGNSSRNTQPVCIAELDQDAVTEKLLTLDAETDFIDWRPDKEERKRREQEIDSFLKTRKDGTEIPVLLHISASDLKVAEHREVRIDEKALELVRKLTDEELVYLCTGEFIGEGSKNIIGDSAITVVGAAGETTGRFRELGIPGIVMADGPSGVRITREYGEDEEGVYPIETAGENLMEIENKLELLPEAMAKALSAMLGSAPQKERRGKIYEQNCSAIPIATAIAQSWNLETAGACAEIVAEEMKHFGIQVWLAPSLNIQRNPLCGRTFEYYSEDPLISGKMAAAVTRAIQNVPGCSVTVKHFICNNQETNRFRSNSMVNERALRDIYAKGFEIVVKESQPHALMSSYNLLNGVHTSERSNLLETLLRREWGYEGIVMSDFLTGDPSESDKVNKYRKFASAESLKAGNDLLMPGGKAHYENILAALRGESGKCRLTREEVEKCAARNVIFVWKLKGCQI